MDYTKTLAEYKARLQAACKEAEATKEDCAVSNATALDYIRADAATEAYGNALMWLDAATGKADSIKFASKEHHDFWKAMQEKTGRDDCFYSALFYTLGILRDTREHINDLYDVEHGIKPSGLKAAWQTTGSYQACLLAFNLFNGYTSRSAKYSTPYEVFEGCSLTLSRCMLEAIRIRHYIH